jgi:hypothetical protein
MEAPDDERRRKSTFGPVPKLDRTMTDIYSDELYSPSFTITSAAPSQGSKMAVSPSNDMFAQRLHAINSQHLNAAHSPVSSVPRDMSPFRHGSPLAPSSASPNLRYGSAQQLRERRKAEQDVHQALRQQMARSSDAGTPQTISPKDAVIEYHESEGEASFPLFPQQGTAPFSSAANLPPASNAFDSMPIEATGLDYLAHQLPSGLQVPHQYPFIAQPNQKSSSISATIPSRVNSAGSSTSADSSRDSRLATKPHGVGADGGTYTCTYHGCMLRFDTPMLLQKHKREGHRQAHGMNGSIRRADAPGMTSSLLNSQAGPHRCDRINPSTGKPCATVFSRPYDLTRHEDTIHNARKLKVRCDLCTEDKTFSRADALTRHYRVCHPDVEFPGKHRRRGVQAS